MSVPDNCSRCCRVCARHGFPSLKRSWWSMTLGFKHRSRKTFLICRSMLFACLSAFSYRGPRTSGGFDHTQILYTSSTTTMWSRRTRFASRWRSLMHAQISARSCLRSFTSGVQKSCGSTQLRGLRGDGVTRFWAGTCLAIPLLRGSFAIPTRCRMRLWFAGGHSRTSAGSTRRSLSTVPRTPRSA